MENNEELEQDNLDQVNEVPQDTGLDFVYDGNSIEFVAREKKEEGIEEENKEEKPEEKKEGEVKAEEANTKTEDKTTEESKDDKVEKEEEKPEEAEEEEGEFFEEMTPKAFTEKMDAISNAKYGVDYRTAMEFKNEDLDAMAEEDENYILERFWRSEEPDITDEEIDAKLLDYEVLFIENEDEQKEYMERENISPRDLIKKQAEFSKLKREALSSLKKLQSNISFDDVVFKSRPGKAEAKPAEVEDTAKQMEAMKEVVSNALKTFDSDEISIKNAKGEEIAKIVVANDESVKNKTMEAALKQRWINADGKFDMERYVAEMNRLEHFDRYMQLAHSAGVDAGKKKEAMDVHNVQMDKIQSPSKDAGGPTASDIALANL